MTSFPWNLKSWAVLIWQSMRSVIDNKPFKDGFWRIPPPMVDEVCTHVREMLEVITLCPSQSLWCNTIVLVHKKDGGLQFCINFHKLNVRTKKDSLSAPLDTRSHCELSWYRILLLLGFEAWFFWQIAMDEASKQYIAFTVGDLGFFWVPTHAVWLCNAQPHSKDWCRTTWVNWTWLTAWFTWWHNCLFEDRGRALALTAHCIWVL